MEKIYTLYILLCGNGEYYTGITSDLEQRIRSHQLCDKEHIHKIKQWTKYHQPVQLAFTYNGLENYSIALKVERYVKSLKKKYKDLLVHGNSYRFRMLQRTHRTQVTKFKLRASTALHSAQIQNPYTVRI